MAFGRRGSALAAGSMGKAGSIVRRRKRQRSDLKVEMSLRIGPKTPSDLEAHAALVASRAQGQSLIAGSPFALASVGLPPAIAKPSRKVAECKRCGQAMKGHKKGQCRASMTTSAKTDGDSDVIMDPEKALSQVR
jgi:hypothetical protein